jgi:hypothetical protein
VTPVVLTMKPINQGWAVYWGEGELLARFDGADAEQRAKDYVDRVNQVIAGR